MDKFIEGFTTIINPEFLGYMTGFILLLLITAFIVVTIVTRLIK